MMISEPLTIHPSLFQASVAAESDLRRNAAHTLAGVLHISFADLLRSLALALHLPGRAATRLQLRMTLKKVLETQPAIPGEPELPSEQLLDTLLQLFSALDLLPSHLRGKQSIQAIWPPTPKGRYLDRIWKAYKISLNESRLYTEGDCLQAFLEREPASLKLGLHPERELRFIGFDDPGPLRLHAMLHLALHYNTSFEFCLLHERADLYSNLEPVLSYIERNGQQTQADIAFSTCSLDHDAIRQKLIAKLFSTEKEDTRDIFSLDTRIRLFEASNREHSLRWIFQEIGKLLQAGENPANIGIVAPDLEAMRPLLRRAIVEWQLPIAYHRSVRVLDTPPFRWLHTLIDLLQQPIEISKLARLARTAQPFGVGPEDAELQQAEAVLREMKLSVLDGVDWSRELVQNREIDEPTRTHIAASLLAWLDWLQPFRKQRMPLADWLQSFRDLVQAMRIPPFESVHDQRHFTLSFHAWQTAEQILSEWQPDLEQEGQPLGGMEFLSWLTAVLDAAIQLRSTPEPESIVVLPPEEAASRRFKHLYILDINDGVFPRASQSIGWLRDDERRQVNRLAGYPLLAGAGRRYRYERMLFTTLFRQAERLTLIAPLVDEQGEELAPSPFFKECRDKLGEPKLLPSDSLAPFRIEWIRQATEIAAQQSDTPLPDFLSEQQRGRLQRLGDKVRIEQAREEFMRQENAPIRAELAFPYTGRLQDNWQQKAPSPLPERYSPAHFETYATCPFRFLVERIWQSEPWEEQGPEPDALAVGLAVHQTLEELCRSSTKTLSLSEEDLQERAYQNLYRALQVQLQSAPENVRSMAQHTAQRWAVKVRRLIEIERDAMQQSPPTHFEVWFGIPHPPTLSDELLIPSEQGPPIRLIGRIDRIDSGSGVISLVDYKSSSNKSRYRSYLKPEAFGITSFQMPIYLLALLYANDEQKPDASISILQARYLLVGNAENKPTFKKQIDSDFVQTYFALNPGLREQYRQSGEANLANQLEELVSQMQAGDFQITPRTCEYCPHAAVCRIHNVSIDFEIE